MYNRSLLPLIRGFELTIKHTHRCLQCRSMFLVREDGCPHCGTRTSIRLLNKLQKSYSGKHDDNNIWYWIIVNDLTGNIEYVFLGDSCPWPRQS